MLCPRWSCSCFLHLATTFSGQWIVWLYTISFLGVVSIIHHFISNCLLSYCKDFYVFAYISMQSSITMMKTQTVHCTLKYLNNQWRTSSCCRSYNQVRPCVHSFLVALLQVDVSDKAITVKIHELWQERLEILSAYALIQWKTLASRICLFQDIKCGSAKHI